MSHTNAEEALGRLLAYLRGLGLTITPEMTREALRLIAVALDEEHQDALLENVIQRLPESFDLPREILPPPAPPVHHGSVHYAGYL